jgi:transposase InsO family protein
MDFIVSLPKSHGFDSMQVVVDRLSKMIHLSPCVSTIDAFDTAKLFVKDIVRLHGVPSEIISDRDPKFTSKFWTSLFKLLGTKLSMSTAAHPESDGQTERTNRTVEVMIRHFVNSQLSDWVDHYHY